ncbi:streptolysin associated protein SagD [Neisseria bacilliformis ATCC BAA-1200]|uniref:Streptolysin associated protein SagD n=1 Tax=Neisseria bacilliformis ATCC BAA-1200 TaxID=888742 RepID=F2BE98_9NEIS|nr:streptolysin associated protein SagD [Neisseria bacilliformis ATCC BAA-1200]
MAQAMHAISARQPFACWKNERPSENRIAGFSDGLRCGRRLRIAQCKTVNEHVLLQKTSLSWHVL